MTDESAETESGDGALKLARQGRWVALVIAGSMLLWLAAQLLGTKLGLTSRYMALIDFAVLAAFTWALLVSFGMWRQRHTDNE